MVRVLFREQPPATAEMEGSYTERYRIIEPFSTTLDEVEGSYSGSSGRELSIGEGAYGKVYKAKDICTNRTVALKKIKCECCEGHEGVVPSTLREVTLLLRLRHENVVQLLDVRMCNNSQRLVMVFELLETDLYRYMRSTGGPQGHAAPLEKSTLHSFSAQLLEGIAFCHSMGVIHRDLKPHNILVDSRGQLKIADFGLARTFTPQQASMTVQVVTRYYRSPELLLGHKQYGFGVDVWSAACIIAEMASGRILFRGDCDIDQLHRIFRCLGTPGYFSNASVLGFRSIAQASSVECSEWEGAFNTPEWRENFPQWPPQKWECFLKNMSAEGISLLQLMLQYDPVKRIEAHRTLYHPFILAYRNHEVVMQNQEKLLSLGGLTHPSLIASHLSNSDSSGNTTVSSTNSGENLSEMTSHDETCPVSEEGCGSIAKDDDPSVGSQRVKRMQSEHLSRELGHENSTFACPSSDATGSKKARR